MAIGISLDPENLEALQQAFHKAIAALLENSDSSRELELAYWIQPSEINETLLDELQCMHPFGQANPEPVFGIRKIFLRNRPKVFGQDHFRFQIDNSSGQKIFGVAWKKADRIPRINEPIDLAVKLKWNRWNGRKYLQMELIDWRYSVL